MFEYRHADGYSESIPVDELSEIADTVGLECIGRSEADGRACAERIVREKLCPCASSVDSLVDAVMTEFRRRIARGRR